MAGVRRELISCHDCGHAVAFTAANCPHCGSREPTGPYILSRQELRRLGFEARNDRRLVTVTLTCTAIGIVWGFLTGASPLWAALGYGLVGACIGPPAAFVINLSRHWFD